ncbi:MAG: hypothetical protein Fur002_18730 [Anaerolineales bacterium]
MEKQIFLQRLERERDVFERLLNQFGCARQLTMTGVAGRLTIKDLLGDILAREQFLADRLGEILQGESYAPCMTHSALERFEHTFGYPDYESPLWNKNALSEAAMERAKNIALDEVVSQELSAYRGVFEALEKLTRAQYLDHDIFHRAAEHTYRPYRRLSAQMRVWRDSISSENQ